VVPAGFSAIIREKPIPPQAQSPPLAAFYLSSERKSFTSLATQAREKGLINLMREMMKKPKPDSPKPS
jgi:hypothetical protein